MPSPTRWVEGVPRVAPQDEIAWRLRDEFGIEDSSGILAEIGI